MCAFLAHLGDKKIRLIAVLWLAAGLSAGCKAGTSKEAKLLGDADEASCTSTMARFDTEDELAAAVSGPDAGLKEINEICFPGRDGLNLSDLSSPKSVADKLIVLDVISATDEANAQVSASALTGTADAIQCKEPSQNDPTGCAALIDMYNNLGKLVEDELLRRNMKPLADYNDRYSGMMGAVSGVGRLIAAITVPHCHANACEVRAKVEGVIQHGLLNLQIGSCYTNREEKIRSKDFNWGAHPCADGLTCYGYTAPTTMFGKTKFGNCRFSTSVPADVLKANKERYARYFTLSPSFVPNASTSPSPQPASAADIEEFPRPATCDGAAEVLSRGFTPGSSPNSGLLGRVEGLPESVDAEGLCRGLLGDKDFSMNSLIDPEFTSRCYPLLTTVTDDFKWVIMPRDHGINFDFASCGEKTRGLLKRVGDVWRKTHNASRRHPESE